MDLRIENLSKTYSNGIQALKDVTLIIPPGMFGLLGPNGAGKSSLMRTISTLQEPDSGTITLGDINVLTEKERVRKILGYLPQEFGVYPKITAESLLDHLAILKGIANKSERKELVSTLLQKCNLHKYRSRNLSAFSGGMKQRFGIAQALLADPKLIIVDEPTAGLDPAERNRFHNLLADIGENTVVILSTHIVDDVRELCTEMAIINQGNVLLTGNPSNAIEEIKGKIWRKRIEKGEVESYREQYRLISDKMFAGKPEIRVFSETQPDPSFDAVDSHLEDVYFSQLFASENPVTQPDHVV